MLCLIHSFYVETGVFVMMGRSAKDQGQLFYRFDLEAVVPSNHLLRGIDQVLDLSDQHHQG